MNDAHDWLSAFAFADLAHVLLRSMQDFSAHYRFRMCNVHNFSLTDNHGNIRISNSMSISGFFELSLFIDNGWDRTTQ
jgi:hypothetical protein